ncbi:MAG: hypothetical protein JRI23_15080 [Deltaproteobacteria bacterium]|jgi:hypothetical protein|nr:hypothetical protein [Deltaproteobacteria bacterium]MBW2533071.1 hypothetical protein [Deltaproteobacteria bacterium]
MRAKIIGVFTIVVILVGALSFALMRATLGDVSNRDDAPRAVTAAVTQLEVEGLRIERWLSSQAAAEAIQEPFFAGTPAARSKTATEVADAINEAAKRSPALANNAPALVVLVDAKGVVLGRNGSALMRGQKLGARHPAMMKAIAAGQTGSDVWVDPAHNEQLLTSYAPVRDPKGEIIGGLVLGTPFSDERLGKAAGASKGTMLVAAVPSAEGFDLPAKSNGVTSELTAALGSEETRRGLRQALEAAGVVDMTGLPEGYFGSARRLAGYGDGKRAVIMAVTPSQLLGSFSSLLWPAVGVILFGLILTFVCAYLLDNYISRPISDLEEGLLAIINGQRDIRFELEHAVLGGLVTRINSLLNELLGIQEDNTDEDGRPSIAP